MNLFRSTGAAGRWTTTAESAPESAWLCMVISVLVGAAITRPDDLPYLLARSSRRFS